VIVVARELRGSYPPLPPASLGALPPISEFGAPPSAGAPAPLDAVPALVPPLELPALPAVPAPPPPPPLAPPVPAAPPAGRGGSVSSELEQAAAAKVDIVPNAKIKAARMDTVNSSKAGGHSHLERRPRPQRLLYETLRQGFSDDRELRARPRSPQRPRPRALGSAELLQRRRRDG